MHKCVGEMEVVLYKSKCVGVVFFFHTFKSYFD